VSNPVVVGSVLLSTVWLIVTLLGWRYVMAAIRDVRQDLDGIREEFHAVRDGIRARESEPA
jgi:hypothetical protein